MSLDKVSRQDCDFMVGMKRLKEMQPISEQTKKTFDLDFVLVRAALE